MIKHLLATLLLLTMPAWLPLALLMLAVWMVVTDAAYCWRGVRKLYDALYGVVDDYIKLWKGEL